MEQPVGTTMFAGGASGAACGIGAAAACTSTSASSAGALAGRTPRLPQPQWLQRPNGASARRQTPDLGETVDDRTVAGGCLPATTEQQTEVSAREAHQRKHIAAGECGCVLSRLRRPASPFYGVREERRRAMPISWGTRERLHSQRLWSQVWLATNAECGRQGARTRGVEEPARRAGARSPSRTTDLAEDDGAVVRSGRCGQLHAPHRDVVPSCMATCPPRDVVPSWMAAGGDTSSSRKPHAGRQSLRNLIVACVAAILNFVLGTGTWVLNLACANDGLVGVRS